MKRIIVSVTNDLVIDHRVHKVCSSLHESGYDVLLVGRKFRGSQSLNRPYKTHRMRLLFNKKAFFYAEYNIRLFFFLLFSRADIFLSNDTDTLPANYYASFFRRKSLVFDAHEIFPEIPELVKRPLIKACWKKIEDHLFPRLKNAYTVCDSIADIYKWRYGLNMQVVRNIPSASRNSPDKKELPVGGKPILLYQGAVNMGRGIEWMLDAMPLLDDCVFVIAGDGYLLPKMKQKVADMNLEDRVLFLGMIPLEELPAYTKAAAVGISLLENMGLNYYYSLPNRIFDFIRAEVPVLTTDFPEIRKIVEEYHIGMLTDSHEPEHLAALIKELLKNRDAYAPFFSKANAELCWENEVQVILEIMSRI